MTGLRRARGGAASASVWGESTLVESAWERSRNAAWRWAIGGVAVGAIAALLLFAPAAWLAEAVARATGQRLLLAQARGTVWNGSAVMVLTGGPDSRDASALPGRVEWTLRPGGLGLQLQARHACCLNGAVSMHLAPGIGRLRATLQPVAGWVGQWPAAWLSGLGTPWNTLQPGGMLRLMSPGLAVESVQNRWRLAGRAEVELVGVSSRLSTLPTLGTYRINLVADPADPGAAQLQLSTREGALQLSGSGQWGTGGVRLRGEARAAAGNEAALSNLLNIIGRRDGDRSVISIG